MMMSTQREEVRLTINREEKKGTVVSVGCCRLEIVFSSRDFLGFLTVLVVLLATNLIPVSLYCPGSSVLVSDKTTNKMNVRFDGCLGVLYSSCRR
jgi:hypothetical protein